MNKLQGKTSLIITAKAIRNFFQGLFCCSLIPYTQHLYLKVPPYFTSLTIFLCALAALLKSHLINRYTNNPLKALCLTYLFFLPTLFITYYNLTDAWPTLETKIIFILGLYSTDGEDFSFYEETERALISPQPPPNNRKKRLIIYNLVGHFFQGLGALAAYAIMTYDLAAVQYVLMVRLSQINILLFLLAIANIALYTAIQLIRAKDQTISASLPHQPLPNNRPLDQKGKITNVVNGLAVGTLCAPFLAYFLQYKFNVHYDALGIVIFALFLLKGVGEEVIYGLPSLKRYFECWNLLSALALMIVYFTSNTNVAIYCILFAIPVWSFGRAALRQRVDPWSMEAEGAEWERRGRVAGILLSSFSFNILYFQPYFAYAFLLSAAFKIASHLLVTLQFAQPESAPTQSTQQTSQIYSPVQHETISEESSRTDGIASTANAASEGQLNTTPQGYSIQRKLPVVIMAILIAAYCLFAYPTYQRHQASYAKVKTGPTSPHPELKLLNSSLAHLWTKEGVKAVALVDCGQDCTESIKERDEYYANMHYDSPNPEWVHFPNMPYFYSVSQLHAAVKIMEKYPSAKGFSVAWDDPIRYNRMPYKIYPLLNELGKECGFHYAEMPSLNLRPLQYRIIKIFTKTYREATTLPPFVGRQPPKNYLAFQTTFKLATNHQYLREFLLYHLRIGYDKFFLYNNDRNTTDPQFYWQYRDAGAFYQKCLNLGIPQEYQNMNQIWEDFYDHVIYVPNLISRKYSQGEGYINYSLFFLHDVVFTSYTDLDEYVYSPSGQYLPDALKRLTEKNVATLRIAPQSFVAYLCLKQQLVIEEPRWMEFAFGALTLKNIILTRLTHDTLVHYKPPTNGLYLNQFESGDQSLDFKMMHFKVTKTYELYRGADQLKIDNSLQPLVKGMKEACKGKCGNSRKPTCAPEVYKQQMERYCP